MIENTDYNKRAFSLKAVVDIILHHTYDQSCLCFECSRLAHDRFACTRRAMKHHITATCTNACHEIVVRFYVDVAAVG